MIDTLKVNRELSGAGFNAEQAEVLTRALTERESDLVTKDYLRAELIEALAPIRSDILLLKWMLGLVLAGILTLILKAFFP